MISVEGGAPELPIHLGRYMLVAIDPVDPGPRGGVGVREMGLVPIRDVKWYPQFILEAIFIISVPPASESTMCATNPICEVSDIIEIPSHNNES